MIHSPPAKPTLLQARQLFAGGKNSSPNHVRIVNNYANEKGVIRRKVAQNLVKQGRAEWVAFDQIKMMTEHPENIAARLAAACSYNAIQDGFEWRVGRSGSATVRMATKGREI